jgi:hypothetical protein
MKILFIVRSEAQNTWGTYRSALLMKTLTMFGRQLELPTAARGGGASVVIELVIQDLAKLSSKQQIELISSSTIIIGVYGAGNSMTHMPIGTILLRSPRCVPKGDFLPLHEGLATWPDALECTDER